MPLFNVKHVGINNAIKPPSPYPINCTLKAKAYAGYSTMGGSNGNIITITIKNGVGSGSGTSTANFRPENSSVVWSDVACWFNSYEPETGILKMNISGKRTYGAGSSGVLSFLLNKDGTITPSSRSLFNSGTPDTYDTWRCDLSNLVIE